MSNALLLGVASDMPRDKLADMTSIIGLDEVIQTGQDILKGQIKGRLIVDVNQS